MIVRECLKRSSIFATLAASDTPNRCRESRKIFEIIISTGISSWKKWHKINIAVHSKALAGITAMIWPQVPKRLSSASGESQKGKHFHRVKTTLLQSAAQIHVTMQKSPSRKALPIFASSKLQAKVVVSKRTSSTVWTTRTAPLALLKATHSGEASVSGQPVPAKSKPVEVIWPGSLGVVSRKVVLVWHALCRRFQRLVAKFAVTSHHRQKRWKPICRDTRANRQSSLRNI